MWVAAEGTALSPLPWNINDIVRLFAFKGASLCRHPQWPRSSINQCAPTRLACSALGRAALGLFIAREMTLAQRSTIAVSSAGGGTTLTVTPSHVLTK